MKKIVIICIVLINNISIFGFHQVGVRYGQKKEDFIQPISIYVDNQKNMYIADLLLGKITIFDGKMNLISYVSGLNFPNNLVKIEDKIYFTESAKNRIGIYDFSDKTISNPKIEYIGSFGMRERFFNHPGNIVYENEEIYIVDENNFRIQVFSMDNSFKREILLPRFEYIYRPKFNNNFYIKFFEDELYVLDNYNRKIYIYKDEKKNNEIDIQKINTPIGLYVYNNKLYTYNRDTNSLVNIKKLSESIELNVTKSDNPIIKKEFFIADTLLYNIDKTNIKVYDLNNNIEIVNYKLETISEYEYIKPVDVQKDRYGNIYVLDSMLSKIIKYNNNEEPIRIFDELGLNPTGMHIDEYQNIYVAVAGENSVRKYNRDGKLIYNFGDYSEYPSNQQYYYEQLEDEEKLKIRYVDSKIYHLDIFVDKDGYIYVLDSKAMVIHVYNQFFNKQYSINRKANILSVALDRVQEEAFGWNERYNDNLTDIYVGDDILVADKFYGRIHFLDKNDYIGYLEGGFSKLGLNSIYKSNNYLFAVDKNNLSIIKFDNESKLIDNYDFSRYGITPLKIRENYIIGTKISSGYNIIRKVYNIEELIND